MSLIETLKQLEGRQIVRVEATGEHGRHYDPQDIQFQFDNGDILNVHYTPADIWDDMSCQASLYVDLDKYERS